MLGALVTRSSSAAGGCPRTGVEASAMLVEQACGDTGSAGRTAIPRRWDCCRRAAATRGGRPVADEVLQRRLPHGPRADPGSWCPAARVRGGSRRVTERRCCVFPSERYGSSLSRTRFLPQPQPRVAPSHEVARFSLSPGRVGRVLTISAAEVYRKSIPHRDGPGPIRSRGSVRGAILPR